MQLRKEKLTSGSRHEGTEEK